MLQKTTRNWPLLSRWTPFEELRDMQQQINHIFGDFYGRLETFDPELPWEPAIDVIENENEFLFKAELPGMKLEDITVTVEGDFLIFAGERKVKTVEDKERFHRMERRYGMFRREIRLPSKVDPDRIEANFVDGILEVHMPVLEIAKPRAIEVTTA